MVRMWVVYTCTMYVYTYFLACGGHKVPTVSPLFVACVVVATAKGLKGGILCGILLVLVHTYTIKVLFVL